MIKNILNISLFWIALLMLSLLPLSLRKFGISQYLIPSIEISAVFCLSIYSNIYPIQIFLYGLLIDIAFGPVIGMSAFLLLMIHKIISQYKNNLTKLDIKAILIYFSITYFVVTMLKFIIYSYKYSKFDLELIYQLIINIIVNILAYPFIQYALRHTYYIKNYNIK